MIFSAALSTAVLAAIPATSGIAHGQQGQDDPSGVSQIPVSFEVQNKNDSNIPCPSDGETYTVQGHITGPADALEGDPDAVSLYGHGHSFGEFLWTFDDAPGFNTVAELADEGGHVSVTYDRLGYGESDKPDGNLSCYGSEADVADQIVQQLRSGAYQSDDPQIDEGDAIGFDRVAFVGHSQLAFGGQAVEYSFNNLDAYVHLSFVDSTAAPPLLENFGVNLADCGVDSQPAEQEEGNPDGYAFRGQTEEDFRETNFVNVPDDVADALTDRRTVDPCGFPFSAGTALSVNNVFSRTIDVPVLHMYGADDPNFVLPLGAEFQDQAFSTSSDDVTLEILQSTGHAMMFSNTAPEFRSLLSEWLTERGF